MSVFHAVRIALRAQLNTVVKATTGALTTLSVTSSGYARSAGSFLTDGFSLGDELAVTGCALAGNNGIALVTGVTALALTVSRSLAAAAAGPAVTIAVPVPVLRAYEGVEFPVLTTPRPYVKERLAPQDSSRKTVGPVALVRHYGSMFYDLYFPAGQGTDGPDRLADAIITAFWDGLILSAGTQRVTIRGSNRSAGLLDAQWYQVPLHIKYQADTINAV